MQEGSPASDLVQFRDPRGARWVATSAFVTTLREQILPAWDELLGNAPRLAWARLVKQSNYRRVLRLELSGGAVFLKAHAIGHFGRRIGQRCCGTRGENEWQKTRLLSALGIATPQPLAAGALQRGLGLARSYYISAEVPAPRTITAALAEERDGARRRQWLEALGRDLACLHAHRLHHRDLHGNNAMISELQARPIWLDLHSLWRVPWLPPWSRMRSIAKLLASLDDELEVGEDEWFLRAYVAASAPDRALAPLLQRARKRARRVRDEQWRSREKRALSGGSKVLRSRGARGRSWRMSFVAEGRVERWYDEALAAEGAAVLKDDLPRARVVRLQSRIESDAASPDEIVVKLELESGWDARIRTWFGNSRARRAWTAAHGLRLRKIAAPAPLALLEGRGGRTLFAMRALPSAKSFESFAAEEAAGLSHAQRAAFVRELALFLARVHGRGGHHDDLSAKNVMVIEGAVRVSFALVDLEDFRLGHEPTPKELVRALGQLNDVPPHAFSARERLRWWARYRRARAMDIERTEVRTLLQGIDAFTRARVERRETRWRAQGKRFETGYFALPWRSSP